MAARAATAKPVQPDLQLSSRDPFALRYVALTALVMALLFGSIWRVTTVAGLTPGGTANAAAGPAWEGWAQPPAYTANPRSISTTKLPTPSPCPPAPACKSASTANPAH